MFLPLLLAGSTVQRALAQSFSNEITLENRSGKDALVKLVGPSPRTVSVRNDGKETVRVGPGTYYILVRYGASRGRYTYSRGQTFTVDQTGASYSVITISLHTVVGGNYQSRPILGDEFDRQ